ncbi:hypothetical protein FQA39_LY06664 [Lamprigera yunnana]|nr:hypothetical protein FQA39_LY06664 [Lamprigera yunnana]
MVEDKASRNLVIGEFTITKPVNTGDLMSAIVQRLFANSDYLSTANLNLTLPAFRQDQTKRNEIVKTSGIYNPLVKITKQNSLEQKISNVTIQKHNTNVSNLMKINDSDRKLA